MMEELAEWQLREKIQKEMRKRLEPFKKAGYHPFLQMSKFTSSMESVKEFFISSGHDIRMVERIYNETMRDISEELGPIFSI